MFVLLIFFVLIMVGTYATLHYVLFSHIDKFIYVYPVSVLFGLQFIAYGLALIKDSGIIKPSDSISFLKLN